MYPEREKKIVATIEARMSSTRLPGKVLMPLAGKPALERLVDRLKKSKYIDEIVIATTVNTADKSIVKLAKKMGVGFWQGSEDDVLSRVLDAAKSVQADLIVEITGDCPLVDPCLVDRGIEEFFSQPVDYAANIIPPSYPNGFDIQVFPLSVLQEVSELTKDPIDRVHVSYYIYKHPERYALRNWEAEEDCRWPDLRVTLDEKADYKLLNVIFEKLLPKDEYFSVHDVVRLLREDSSLLEINKYVRQKSIQEG